jgi:serine/threonine protein kinase
MPSTRMTMSSTVGPGGAAAATIVLDLPVEFLSHYEILDSLGKGGMGEVFRARDLDNQRDVAIKFCVAHKVPGARERFEQEAALMARIRHPNVLSVLTSGEVEKIPYLVMPLVRGDTLRALLGRRKKLPMEEAVRVTHQVLAALDAAHNSGVIHRDLKPENVVVQPDGNVMVLDLGVAKSWADGSAAKEGAAISGTPAYMPPEQCKGLPTGVAADLYAAGAMLFEMLAGHPPYCDPSPRQVMKLHIEAPIPRVTESCPELPGSWDHLLAKALAKSTSDRFADAKAFQMALSKAAAGEFNASALPAARHLERKSLAAMSQSTTAMVVGTGLIGAFLLVSMQAALAMDLALGLAALLPITAIFFCEEPGRFVQLSARGAARFAVYGSSAIVLVVMMFAQRYWPETFEFLMIWMLTVMQLAWFGGYHDRDPLDRDGIELHRRANILVTALTFWMLSFFPGILLKTMGVLTMALTVLGSMRPPTRTKHLGIGAATTMILMPHLLEEAAKEEVAAAGASPRTTAIGPRPLKPPPPPDVTGGMVAPTSTVVQNNKKGN